MARITSRSSNSAVSMPMLMPALAITTSGRPCRVHLAAAARDIHRQVRAQPLGVHEGVQEFAIELDRIAAVAAAADDACVAQQLHLAAIGVADGTPRAGFGDTAVGGIAVQAHA